MFYSDKPISSHYEDVFHRSGFAKVLAKSMLDMDNTETYTIGLFGKWGSGKTSLLNMMLNEIETLQNDIPEDNKCIIIHFEPWNFSDTNQLLNQFFVRLANYFSSNKDKNLNKIGAAIEKYANAFEFLEAFHPALKLIPFLGKNAGKKMQKGLNDKDTLQQKELVVNLLKQQSRRIIIVMDDIDRLSNDQIRQVFQLISSVAKFPNTTYLLAFDKDIVVKALSKVQEGHGEDYLEKIIQMPIHLPEIQYDDLRQVLLSHLYNILEKNKNVGFEQSHWDNIFSKCIEPYIENIRDINRLCNIVQFKLTSIGSEIDFADMVAISTFELVFPEIYTWIKSHKSILVGASTFELPDKRTPDEQYEHYKKVIEQLLSKNGETLEKNSLVKFVDCLSLLFPYFGNKIGRSYTPSDTNTQMRLNQISHIEKFDRYFHLDIESVPLKKVDLMYVVLESSCKELEDFLLNQAKNEKSFELIKEIGALLPIIPSNRVKTVSQALINTSAEINTITPKPFLSMSYGSYAELAMIELIDKLLPEERYPFISTSIENSTLDGLQILASLINTMELSYGRLAANGQERNYKKIVTLDELIQLETVLCTKIKSVLKTHSLFDFREWGLICYLLEFFDNDYIRNHLIKAFSEDANILKYLAITVNVWIGNDYSYEVREEYTKFLTKEQIMDAINRQKENGLLFKLPERIQSICVAFFLHEHGTHTHSKNIPQKDIDDMLNIWRKNFNEKANV